MSSFTPERPPPPKKETVYAGPDVYAISSSSNPFPQAVPLAEKKETVYGQQAQLPAAGFETPPPQTPRQETVFGGPMPNTGQKSQQQQQQSASTQTAYSAGVATLSRSANWFFWVAGLSVINTIMFVKGSTWGFLAGLGITADLARAAQTAGNDTGQALAVGVSLFAAAAFAGIGLVARKGVQWAFILGIILYLADSALVLLSGAWLMLAFHAWVLYSLWVGFSHCRRLDEFRIGG